MSTLSPMAWAGGYPTEGLPYPLGPIGGHGFAPYDKGEMKVTQLDAGAPGDKAGLKVGDVIVAANGVPFPPHSRSVGAGGDGPPRVLGDQIEISEATSEGGPGLVLTVKRDETEMKIAVNLPRQPALSKTWPEDCPKSEAYLDGICRFLAATQRGGHWVTGYGGGADYTTTAWAALTLLGSGDKKYDPNVKATVDFFRQRPLLGNWDNFIVGNFLCEYYLMTGDESVMPMIQARVDRLVSTQGKEGGRAGRFGHHNEDITYGGGGLNIVTSGVVWFWAMARHVGADVPQDAWDRSFTLLKRHTGGGGGVGYSFPSDDHQGHGRTGQTLLGAFVADLEPDYRKRWSGWLVRNRKSVRENHAFTLPGMAPAFAAVYATDPDGYRAYMDEWRWYFTLNRRPDFSADYIPGKENSGGDLYLNQRLISNACLGYILCSMRRHLWAYGHYPRIDGIRWGELSPQLKVIYTMIRDKNLRLALHAAEPIRAGDTSDKKQADLLYEYAVIPARKQFNVLTGDFGIDALYEGRVELTNFGQLYGDLSEFRARTADFNERLEDPASQQQLVAGRTYHLRLDYIAHTPGVKENVFNEFLKDYPGAEPYVAWVKQRLAGKTPDDLVARLASLVGPQGDDAVAAEAYNKQLEKAKALHLMVGLLRPKVAPLQLPPQDTTDVMATRAKLGLRQLDAADRLREEGKYFDAIRTYTMVSQRYDDTPAGTIARQWVIGYRANEPMMKAFVEAERKKEAKRLYELAESLKQTGHKDVADKQLKMLVDLYPESEYATKARRELTAFEP
ncbi:MAG: hypothetical protein GC159_14800 [Phycisphaera sp.]|nr:hypothetical protein [Phycisphaera sp.]